MERITRILVEPDGRAVLVRTPILRSLRFRSLDDARAFHGGEQAAMVPVLVAALVLVMAKAILPMMAFLPVLLVGLIAAAVASGVVMMRARRSQPAFETMSWEESVAIDDQPVEVVQALKDLGVGLLCAGMLAFFAFVLYVNHRHVERQGAVGQLVIAVGFVALLGGVWVGAWMGIQRLRFLRTRSRVPPVT